MKKIIDKIYNKRLVIKPWGSEYVIYQDKNALAITLLKINFKDQTSLHCHPKKKTGFILLDGSAEIQLGLWKSETKLFKSPSKLMIRAGLFHSIKCASKRGLIALEFETPVKKNDLVRYQDYYGRSLKPYEGKNFIKNLGKKDIIFRSIKANPLQKYKIGKVNVKLKTYKSFSNIINQKNKTIFAVIDGAVTDNKNRNILSKGDIIKTGTFIKLSKKFKIKNKLVLLSVSK